MHFHIESHHVWLNAISGERPVAEFEFKSLKELIQKKKINAFINGSFNIKGAAQQFRVPLVVPIKVLSYFMGSTYLAHQMECFLAPLDLTHVSIW